MFCDYLPLFHFISFVTIGHQTKLPPSFFKPTPLLMTHERLVTDATFIHKVTIQKVASIALTFHLIFLSSITPNYAIDEPSLNDNNKKVSSNQSNKVSEYWNFDNGNIRLSKSSLEFPGLHLNKPRLLGSGGGGAVFSCQQDNTVSSETMNKDVIVKVSWLGSTESVDHECDIIRELEKYNVRGVEKCIGKKRYPYDERRIMIAMQPVVEDAVSNIQDVNIKIQEQCVRSVISTMVDMLAANIVTVDVQPLISKSSGKVIFIDMTEAKQLSNPPTTLDLAYISSFCSEMLSLIPNNLNEVAVDALSNELKSTLNKGIVLPEEVIDIIHSISGI